MGARSERGMGEGRGKGEGGNDGEKFRVDDGLEGRKEGRRGWGGPCRRTFILVRMIVRWVV